MQPVSSFTSADATTGKDRRQKAASPTVCVFDAYGTLFDVAGAARSMADALGAQWKPLAALWRQKQLEYSWLHSLMGTYRDFRHITADALDYAMEALTIAPKHGPELMALYDRLPAYPEVASTLTTLRAQGLKTAILSNGSPDMLNCAIHSAGLDGLLDVALSIDPLRLYKPDQRVYALATDHFSVNAADVAFFSSNGWDIAGARTFGFHCCWINRAGLPVDRLPATPDRILKDLSGAPHLFKKAGE